MSTPLLLMGLSMIWALLIINLTTDIVAKYIFIASIILILLNFLLIRGGILPIENKTLSLDKSKNKSVNMIGNNSVLVSLISIAIITLSFILKTELIYKPIVKMEGTTQHITGEIIKIEPQKFTIKTDEGYKVRLSSKTFNGQVGDLVDFNGKIFVLNYQKAKGVYIGTYTYEKIKVTTGNGSIFEDMRIYIKTTIYNHLPSKYADVLIGMLMGDKTEIEDDIYDSFKVTGVVHLLSVSGFHTSLWSMIIYRQFLRFGLGKRLSSAFAILFILGFLALTGFARSTIRASIMLIFFFISKLILREADSLNSLGGAATLIVLADPFAVMDIGFLLSFFSTLGILLINPKLHKLQREKLKKYIHNFKIRQKIEGVLAVISVSISAFIFTLPFMVLFIGEASLISPLTNLFVTTFASFSILLGGVAILVSLIPLISVFEEPLFLVSGLIVKFIVFVTEQFSKISFASAKIGSNYMLITLAAVLFLWGFAFLCKGEKNCNIRLTVILSLLILCSSIFTYNMLVFLR